jgi:hypothetical protein
VKASSRCHCLNAREKLMRIAIAVTLMLAPSMLPVANAADPRPGAAAQSQFATAYAVLGNMKRNVAEAWASSGRFPPTYSEAGLNGPVLESYFTIELGSEGLLKITFNASADPVLVDAEVTTVPTINESGDMVWHCFAPKIPRYVRPGCG